MIDRIYKFILLIINRIIIDRFEDNFIKHNKALFNSSKNKNNKILIELNNLQPNNIAISHFSKVLSEIHDAQLAGYRPQIQFNLYNKFKFFILNYKIKKIYRSFGVNEFLDFDIKNYKTLANNLTKKLMLEINSKLDLENLIVDDVWVGDLIYDQYLSSYKVPTVNIKSDELKKILFEFSLLYYYWKDLFSKKKIKAIIISHACYFMGLPARIAITLGISVYQVNLQTIYYLTKKNIFPYNEFHLYKNNFEKLDTVTKNKAIVKAQERLKLIFEGRTDVDQPYILHSAYAQEKTSRRIIVNKNPIKILIASHSFYDAPHGHGLNLFPDFFEWLEFLGELSNKTDYEWYIKTHPGIEILDQKTIDDFVLRYKKIILIPNKTSHHQLIEEGINIVLTVYGSIGIEYAAQNITVINASLNNPHIAYDFNIHPKSKKELNDIILNLNSYINLKIFSEDIYKCYYMKYLHNHYNIFFYDYESVIKNMGGYNSSFSSKIYDIWINYFTPNIQAKIESKLKKFILLKKYKFNNEV